MHAPNFVPASAVPGGNSLVRLGAQSTTCKHANAREQLKTAHSVQGGRSKGPFSSWQKHAHVACPSTRYIKCIGDHWEVSGGVGGGDSH